MAKKKPAKPSNKKLSRTMKDQELTDGLFSISPEAMKRRFQKKIEVEAEPINPNHTKYHFNLGPIGKTTILIRQKPVKHAVLLLLQVKKPFKAKPGGKGRGIGSFLLNHACEFAQSEGAKFIVLPAQWRIMKKGEMVSSTGQEHPVHFYLKHGFKPIRESERHIPEKLKTGDYISVAKDLVPGNEKLKFRVLKHLERRARKRIRQLDRKERKERRKKRKADSKQKKE